MDHARGERRFVHGDFSLSNLLIDDQEDVSAVLDWEVPPNLAIGC